MSQSDIIRKADRFGRAAIRERLRSPQMVQKMKAVRYPSFTRTYSVKIQEDGVPSNATGPFTCKLLDQDGNETGDTIDVYPRTHLGSNDFDGDVWPDLAAGDGLAVYKDWDGKWYFSGCIFDDTTDCTQ